MHAKTDSELTSLAPSSPDRHPIPAYFVQSPSHDGEKTTTSFNSTPMLSSPVGSPRHSSAGGHSRESSTSRYSGPVKPAGPLPGLGPMKIAVGSGGRGRGFANWEFDLMEEDDRFSEDDDEERERFSSRCYFLAFFVGFFVVFSLFSLILWGLSKPQKPRISMQVSSYSAFRFLQILPCFLNYISIYFNQSNKSPLFLLILNIKNSKKKKKALLFLAVFF